MTKIENFIREVEAEAGVALDSGIVPPDPKRERPVLERLNKKYPELGINPEKEQKIRMHARLLLNAHNN
ncbi:hypothetical protein A2361_01065 [Candidatus Woesebacteria bacterium RIFOXYB1_FULL_40_26]|uniref:Uncharacterized protein n=2 Tax=Candidatus Woeseibacteriota TaxID=1752722 RepID=A0A1F8CUW1_9BACT|nr:MAG: hypothetical protein UT72_C0024G0004 [Candidatus Woesebacteria bacterium GW2011_GWB1_40_101]OGM80107.1 MAG: hypothetical protein A2361_01065 [Candidatus Woesebacteria bacterium RIFOXYB1_FULL_40_26]